jgi:hypothetical protein
MGNVVSETLPLSVATSLSDADKKEMTAEQLLVRA